MYEVESFYLINNDNYARYLESYHKELEKVRDNSGNGKFKRHRWKCAWSTVSVLYDQVWAFAQQFTFRTAGTKPLLR